MKVQIVGADAGRKGEVELPSQFSEEYHPDLIARAVFAVQANSRQPYGAAPEAGKGYSAKLSRRRRNFKTAYGRGISRVPRKTMSRRGSQFNWVGALAPGTVGGRQAHPPKSSKVWSRKINVKEKRKAIRSAIAATVVPELVKARGHLVPDAYPFVADSSFESLGKTKEVIDALDRLGFAPELSRAAKRKVRAGKGKGRGRRYKLRKGPLIIVSEPGCRLLRSARNIPGIDVAVVSRLNAELLAPGASPGRLALFTAAAVERLGKEGLFT